MKGVENMGLIAEMNTWMKQAAEQVVREHDDLLFSWLEPFGVTRENVDEYGSRILIQELPTETGNIRDYFLDNNYIFSIEEVWTFEAGNEGNWHGSVNWKQFFREKED
jgi:hypothetical protein